MAEEYAGQIVDVIRKRIFPGTLVVDKGTIAQVREEKQAPPRFLLPGLIDAHVHIESSMLVPAEFARLAVLHGTVGTVSDPHEIANVLGSEGVEFMIENGKRVPFCFAFGAPSCVPATSFETAGAALGPAEVRALLQKKEIYYLSEMMNYPGVLHHQPDVMEKIAAAKEAGKPVDGHCPGLRGEELKQYIRAGISTDHESFTYEEGKEKLEQGMKLLIREGSAAKNFEALVPLIQEFPDQVMFCSDDKHPDDLIHGHMNLLLQRTVRTGIDPLTAIRAVTKNPVEHYRLPTGLLQTGDPATFIEVKDLQNFEVLTTYYQGEKVAEKGRCLFSSSPPAILNRFSCTLPSLSQLAVPAQSDTLRLIEVIDGELITKELRESAPVQQGKVVSDPSRDILKIAVVNRYRPSPPAIAFVKRMGLKKGAIASSVAHDSHNLIGVGADDASLLKVFEALAQHKGGIAVTDGTEVELLPLPIAGLMSPQSGQEVARSYEHLTRKAKELGTPLHSPFMTLSFLALLVIPEIKLSDKGLFDALQFAFISPFVL